MTGLAGQLAQELLLVQAVFERFAAIDKHDRYFVGELPAQAVVAVNVDLVPAKAPTAFQLGELFLDDFTQMAAFAGVHNDFSGNRCRLRAHASYGSLANLRCCFQRKVELPGAETNAGNPFHPAEYNACSA